MPDLREYCFGGFEGELTHIVHDKITAYRGLPSTENWLAAYRHGERNLIAESVHALDPLGLAETEAQFSARLQQGLDELIARTPHNGRALLVSHGIAITTILGYTAMSGIVGGGGLGKIAINYGYYRYKYLVMLLAVILLIIIVQVFQSIGTHLSVKLDKRLKQNH